MSRTNDKTKHTPEFFTSDPDFIFWCLDPESPDNERWSDYTARNPQDEEAFERAVKAVKGAGRAQEKMPPHEKAVLLERILSDYAVRRDSAQPKRPKMLRRRILQAAAAAVVAAGIVSAWTFGHGSSGPKPPSIETCENITLVSKDDRREIPDDIARISCNSRGEVVIDGKSGKAFVPVRQKMQVHTNELIVPKGKRAFLQLADGTRVWVNSASVFRFPTGFGDTRDVFVEGEAYFEVAKDPSRPFIVHTDRFATRVLGTSFDVSTTTQEGVSAVVLVEGAVAVDVANGESVTLEPSERFVMKDCSYSVYAVDPYEYISWKDGLLFFSSNTLVEVMQRVAAFYKIDITCAGDVGNRTCSGKLVLFDDMDYTLGILSDLFRIGYTRQADGSIIVREASQEDAGQRPGR